MGEELLKKRFIELAKKSYNGGIFLFTDFLGLLEMAEFQKILPEIRGVVYESFGGVEGAERVMIRFGDKEELGYELSYPIVTLKIEPVSQKFADKLTHRDFLGAILNLGIERSKLGDILISDNVGYLFCTESVAPYIESELSRIKHTEVKVSVIDSVPTGSLFKLEGRSVCVSGERLDAVIAKLFHLSRESAQSLFTKKLVFVNGKQCESTSYIPKPSEVVSVRGLGRFIYRGQVSETKKGRLNIAVDLYV